MSTDNDGPTSRAPTPTASQVPTRAMCSTTQATKSLTMAPKGDCPYKVQSVEDGEKYLCSKLLSLASHLFTLEHISTTFFHISQIESMPLPVAKAICTVAFIAEKECASHTAEVLIKHIKDTVVNKVIVAISPQIGKILVASECITEASDRITAPKTTKSYADAIKSPTTTTTLACAVIEECQVLLDPQEGHSLYLNNTPSTEISNKLAEIIDNIQDDNKPTMQIKAITKLRNSGLIVELDKVESAKWIKSKNIANQFLAALDIPTCFKQGSYPVIVPFLPISSDIENPEQV